MKKKDIVNLIRCHAERNESGFRAGAAAIAREFDANGDSQLAAYVMSLISGAETFVPQAQNDAETPFMRKDSASASMLLFPDSIVQDILGVVNAVKHRLGVNKFLFKGAPGTGKTEAARHLARILNRELYIVQTESLVDSKLGQTQKNVMELFHVINLFAQPNRILVLFDEIDSLALDRTNPNDLREMGRATSAVLKGLDDLNPDVVFVATTNLFEYFDKALSRRFDFIVDFNRYGRDDILMLAERMLDGFLSRFKLANRDIRLFRKILSMMDPLPLPGDLKNLIRTSVAFSDPQDGVDYFRRLYRSVCQKGGEEEAKQLQEHGFTVREIGILLQKSKSGVARELKEVVS